MKRIILFLIIFVSSFYLSQNTEAAIYGSLQTCYYGSNCALQGYSTPGEVYCSDYFSTYEKGYPTCNYGACCGSYDYCSSKLSGFASPTPSACTPANCYYSSQQDCTGGRVCSSTGCACPSDKPNWDGTNCIACPPGQIWDSTNKICKTPIPKCTDPTGLRYSDCTNAGCYWCSPPGYCTSSSETCTTPCTYKAGDSAWNDAQCADRCDSTGCNVQKWRCGIGNSCVYNMEFSSCSPDTTCSGSSSCYSKAGSCGGSGSSGGSTSGSCSYYNSNFGVCSSGCPTSYPNQQWVGCAALPGCNGGCGYASYNPIVGETPCCTSGGYYTCNKQEECTTSGIGEILI